MDTTTKPTYNRYDKEEIKQLGELTKRVRNRINALPKRAWYLQVKVFIFPIIYFTCYFIALFHGDNALLYISMYVIMGLTLVLIYANLIHEAAHNNVFPRRKTKWLNNYVLGLFNLIGANAYIWKKRHLQSHHSYPNVDGWDTDIEQSGLIKIIPNEVKAVGVQKYQDRFIFFIYPLYLFNWLFLRDFKDFFSKKRTIYRVFGAPPLKEKVKLIVYKLFYVFYQIAVPMLFFKVSFGLAFGAWFLQILVGSIFALFILLPLHPLPDNQFPVPDENNTLPYSWLRHQLEVTNDLTHNNWFIRNVLGNFNFHVAHHLFPSYSYAYYNEITDEIQKFAKENNLPYKRFPLFTALKKHYTLLKMNAHDIPLKHVFEELDS